MRGLRRIGLIGLMFIVLSCLMVSCRSQRVVETSNIENSTDTIYINKIQKDSVYVHDSVWYEVMYKNDTVWKTKEVYKYLYKDKFVHDTCYVSHVDSIRVTDVVVRNELTAWQNWQINFGRCMLIFCVLVLVGVIIKMFLK